MVLLVFVPVLMFVCAAETRVDLEPAQPCDPGRCKPPNCRCSDDYNPPGELPVKSTPQIVMLTFDDGLNTINFQQYENVFQDLSNPNGCPAVGTLFISHYYTNYMAAEIMYTQGFETADHSVTHQEPVGYWEKANYTVWKNEIGGQKEILHKFANIPYKEVVGFRAPFLMFTENMFKALYALNFTYDLSWPAAIVAKNGPMYPYTMDYLSTQQCPSLQQPCPTMSYPGLWEIPNVDLMNEDGTICGAMVDACLTMRNETEVLAALKRNFHYHYDANRAPFGLHIHSAWFAADPSGARMNALKKFLNYAQTECGAWFLSGSQVIAWMKDPQDIDEAKSFPPWKCPKRPKPRCDTETVNNCHYTVPLHITMPTCTDCPPHFPSPTDPDGNSGNQNSITFSTDKTPDIEL